MLLREFSSLIQNLNRVLQKKYLIYIQGLFMFGLFSLLFSGCSRSTLEYTEDEVFYNAKSQDDYKYIEKITIFSAIIYSSDEIDNRGLERYQLTSINKSLKNNTQARKMMLNKVSHFKDNLKRECNTYLKKYPYWSTVYHAYILESFGASPKFSPTENYYSMNDKNIKGSSKELSELMMSVFSAGGGIDGWKPMIKMMRKYTLNEPFLSLIEDKLYKYLKLKKQEGLTFSVIYNPLMHPHIGINAFPNPRNRNQIVFITGPWTSIQALRTNISHEMMHPIVNKLYKDSEKFKKAINETEILNKNITGERWGYDNWYGYFAEEVIRAVSTRVEGEYQAKFQHTDLISKRLKEYEESNLTFETFLVKLLNEMKTI